MRRAMILSILSALLAAHAVAGSVSIPASQDATLIEDADGSRANGAGFALFVGRTNQRTGSVRRALLRFDLDGAVPDRAIIERVTVTLFMWPSHSQLQELRLHRVLADWSEGPSVAFGGAGIRSEPGDVTWLHTSYDQEFWTHNGGQFSGRASARLEIGASGYHTWASTHHLLQDVRLWRSNPRVNFGWIVIGGENAPQTVKGFASREDPDPMLHPIVEITYRLPGERPLRRPLVEPE